MNVGAIKVYMVETWNYEFFVCVCVPIYRMLPICLSSTVVVAAAAAWVYMHIFMLRNWIKV